MNKKRIALFGGSFNPPGLHHRQLVENLLPYFDEIVIIPCGPRPDKVTVNEIAPADRAEMVKLNFRGLPGVRVELFDILKNKFTRTHALQKMFESEGEVWHIIGTDWICGGRKGESLIHKVWERGPELWETLNFSVTDRGDFPYRQDDLPPHHRFFKLGVSGSSSKIREMVRQNLAIGHLVLPEVRDYIRRHKLYRREVGREGSF